MKNSGKKIPDNRFFELSQDLMCVAGFDKYFRSLNPAWEKLLGYSEKELFASTFLDIVHSADHQKIENEIKNLSKGTITVNFETRVICKNGSVKYFEWTGTPVPEEKIMYCIGRDITARKKSEALSNKQSSNLKFLNSIAIPLTDSYNLNEFSEFLLKGLIKHTGASLAAFSYYHPDKKELQVIHIESKKGILNAIVKIAGKKITETVSPVDDKTYQLILRKKVVVQTSFAELTFGAIPEFVDRAIRAATGIDKLFPIAHVIEGELYGTTMIAFKKEQPSPSIEMLKSYGHLLSVALRRYNAEKALEESEQKFRQLFENMEQGFALHEMIYDDKNRPVDYRFVLTNKSFEKLTGKNANDFIGKTVKQLLPKTEDVWIEKYGSVAKTGKPLHFEHYAKEFDKYYNVIAYSPKKDFFATIFTDTTKFKLNQIQLIKAKEKVEEIDFRLNLAIDSGKLGIWDLDTQNNTLVWNKRMYELYGISEDKFTSNVEAWESGLHPDDKEKAIKELQLTIESKKSFNTSFRVIHPDKRILHIKADGNVIRNKKGKPTRVIGINRDITEIVTHQEELIKAKEKAENSEIRFKAISEQAMDGIALTDMEGNYLFVNKSFCEMMGYSEQELLKLKVFDLRADDAGNDLFQQIKNGKNKGASARTKLLRKDNSNIYVHLNGTILNLGKEKYIMGIHRDVTELVHRENELIVAKEKAEESDRLKSAFLANMSHEIRTPMNGILGFTNLLKTPDLSGKEQNEYISIIEKSGERMLNTINDIIDISKIESGQVKINYSIIDLNELLDEQYEFFLHETRKKGIKLAVVKSPNHQVKFKSDKEKINSVLTNFIKNAIKFTHSGSIEIGYAIDENTKQNKLKIYVKDTGIGIPPERKNAVFERFVQADIEDKQGYEGSGLGLAISKAYVEMLNGEVGVESEEEIGSEFWFTLPVELQQYEKAENNSKPPNQFYPNSKKLKILIAEDEKFSVAFLEIVLKEYGKEIIIAKTGNEAVEACRRNPDIDIILMDIKMPEMDGYEATRIIRKFNSDVFIVAQTAFAQTGDREKALEAGCNEYVTKPINKNQLLEIISTRF